MKFYQNTELITIEQPTEVRDTSGGFTYTWSVFAQPYAYIRYSNGTERMEGSRDSATTKAIFKVRFDSDTKNITNKMRINYGGYWDITSIVVQGRGDSIELAAEKKDS